MRQEVINRLMIREARRGQQVVRLKGGDPFVLGRGGEEALALAAAGIPFEIIPGISSSVAGPALAGIPVTHRGLASGFVVLSGHSPAAYAPAIAALAPDAGLTIVVLMGHGARADLCERLLARGFPASTPAALVVGAATPAAWRWLGVLGDLPAVALPEEQQAAGAPVLIVVGAVVTLAETLAPIFMAATDIANRQMGGDGQGGR
jgi:uroporphyrin-III C-methyltransferase/precorrin-2 dehydrogenase/sirohydrochlorin ferrochelatase